jgi:hypothetical protein
MGVLWLSNNIARREDLRNIRESFGNLDSEHREYCGKNNNVHTANYENLE